MDQLLSGFQTDLGKLSSEIQSLQDQSLNMSVRLKNRLVSQRRSGLFIGW